MSAVAFVTYRKSPKIASNDALCLNQFDTFGYAITACPWDDTLIDWNQFDAIIIRSCWDYHLRINEFKQWLNRLKIQNLKVFNPIDTVLWNSDKKYLFDLQKKGVPTPQTYLISNIKEIPITITQLMNNSVFDHIVLKPVYGASSYQVWKYTIDEKDKISVKIQELLQNSPVLIQEYMPEIETDGELSLVFFNRVFSHVVKRMPKIGEFRNSPKLGSVEESIIPPDSIVNQAQNILNTVPGDILYARVDGIMRNNIFVLNELELIEPYLFFEFDKESPVRFAKAVNEFIH
jgi:glutathione synthase/RimK-type ligase-like ATP-grasp enzyme